MAKKRIKRPVDVLERAKLIGDIATGQVEDEVDARRFVAKASLIRSTSARAIPSGRTFPCGWGCAGSPD